MSTPLAGTFLLEDCDMISSGIKNGDWVEGGMGAFAAAADGVAMVVDPLGSVIGMGIGWLIEHMEPITGATDTVRSLTHGAKDAPRTFPEPSPAVRPPNAPALSIDDNLANLVAHDRAHVPGSIPSYRGDVDTVVAFFDEKIMTMFRDSDVPQFGREGTATFVMPVDDANLIHSVEDAVVATGGAPSVEGAWRNGQQIFGLEVPADGIDLRVPTRVDSGDFEHFVEGGYTAIAEDELFKVNRIRELVAHGKIPMPHGTVLFELMPDGSRLPLGMF